MAMNDEHSKNGSGNTAEKKGAGGTDAANQNEELRGAEADEAAEQSDTGEDPFEVLKKENEELKDRYIRLAAEMENLRRRTARDVKEARAYAIANFARDMLAVSDNLQRAQEAIPEEARRSEDAGYKALIDGVELTERDMLAALERHGVRKLDPQGEKFDPNFHQAMFEVPNSEVPHNSVFQVVQAGYVIGDRVLRPAMVGVAKGGPKTGGAETAGAQGDGGADQGSREEEPAKRGGNSGA
jgi:molecular chaperone GrpE